MMFFLRKLKVIIEPIRKRSLFALGIIGWVLVLGILTPLLLGLLSLTLGNLLAGWQISKTIQVSDIILFITAAFILAYTYEAKKLREESVFQNKMSSAIDLRFRMTGNYLAPFPDKTTFAELSADEAFHNVSKVAFLTMFSMKRIGRCAPFEKFQSKGHKLVANYFIATERDRKKFVRTLFLQDGEVTASVLMSNGTKFLYTFRTTGDNWKRTWQGQPNLNDVFVLVKKELDE
jgi:MFS family permease